MSAIRHKQAGFTIAELLIVIVVIGILAAITVVAYNGVQNRARTAALQASVSQAATKIETLRDASGNYPASVSSSDISTSSDITYDYRKINDGFCITVSSPTNGSYFATNISSRSVGPCPVGYWTLDGSADDKSPYQNNGTVNGATITTDRSGRSNGAYSFTSGNSISIPAKDFYGDKKYSVSLWIYTDQAATGSWRQLFLIGSGSTVDGRSPGIWLHPDTMQLHDMQSNGTTQFGIPASKAGITISEWTNVIATSTGDSGTLNLYINGQLDSTLNHSDTLSVSSHNVTIGGGITGKMDDVRIYDRILTPTEVKQLYEAE